MLKGIFNAIDEIPEGIREYYVEKDGKYHLQVSGMEHDHEVQNLKQALVKERESALTLSKTMKTLENIGIDTSDYSSLIQLGKSLDILKKNEKDIFNPSGIAQVLTKLSDLEKMNPEQLANEKIESFKMQLKQQHINELTEKDSVINNYKNQLSDTLITSAAINALAKKGLKNPELLLPHVKDRTKIVEDENGKMAIRVIGKDGNAIINKDTNYAGINDLVELFSQDPVFAPAFPSSGNSGIGTPPNSGAGNNNLKTIKITDQAAINANWEKINNDEITVVD